MEHLSNLFVGMTVLLLSGCSVMEMHGHYQTTKANLFLMAMTPDTYFKSEMQLSLVKAAGRCDNRRIEALLTKGADLDGVGEEGMTPLTWMVVKRDYKGLICLLEAGATPDFQVEIKEGRERYYVNALQYAVAMRDTKYMKALLDYGADPALSVSPVSGTPVAKNAMLVGQKSNIKILVDYGFDVNYISNFGYTPIKDAVAMQRYEIALWLYENGADPVLRDESIPYAPFNALESLERYGRGGVNRWTRDNRAYHRLVDRLIEDGYMEEMRPERLYLMSAD